MEAEATTFPVAEGPLFADGETLAADALEFLAAVDLFRAEGCDPFPPRLGCGIGCPTGNCAQCAARKRLEEFAAKREARLASQDEEGS